VATRTSHHSHVRTTAMLMHVVTLIAASNDALGVVVCGRFDSAWTDPRGVDACR
jgi:hypothetical protein